MTDPHVNLPTLLPSHTLYASFLESLSPEVAPSVIKWLLTNDLYFLLRYGLNRPFVESRWWFDRCREVQAAPDGYLDLWAREHGKAQSLDELTPTPSGWKAHGELNIGDEIFSPDGSICHVVALSPIFTDCNCYEIEFDDGTKIKASVNHLWEVERKTRKRLKGTFSVDGIGKRKYREKIVLKTSGIAIHDHRPDNRLSIPVNAPLQLPEAELAIDPYLFGAWIGDGNSDGARICSGHKDADEMECLLKEAGAIVKRVKHSNCIMFNVSGSISGKRDTSPFMAAARLYGVLNNKHIPLQYLRGSYNQRIALLQGLMDTDGTCDKRGTAMFCAVNKKLAEEVMELCHTLGLKPCWHKHNSIYRGNPHVSYQVQFQAYKELPVFRLKRKIARCKDGARINPRRYIVACRPIESEPMRCIQIDRSDGLYLTSKSMVATHNSTVITIALTIFDILRDPEITVGIFSHTRPIAKSFLRVIKREFETNETLKEFFPEILYSDPQSQSSKWAEDQGITVIRKGNPPEATVEAHGLVDGMPTGRHFQLRVYDDVCTAESVSTPEQMRKVEDAVDMSNNLGKRGGQRRMIGTRYKLSDIYDTYINRGVVKPRIYPATDNGRADGVPVYFSQEEWDAKLLDMSPAIIASQMLQNPLAQDSVIFQPDWFRLWPAWLDEARTKPNPLPVFDAVFLSLDGAFSEKNTADDSCLLALGLFRATEGSDKYSMMVVDCMMEKLAYPALRDEVIRQFQNKFGASDKGVDAIIIEDKASGQALIPDLRRAGMAVYPYNPGRLDKTARANLVSHLVRDGYLWLPESTKKKAMVMSWLSKFYEQMLYFPNVKHEDAVDAVVQALSVLNKYGFLNGKAVPKNEVSYWKKLQGQAGNYSGDIVAPYT